jgi:hypothetical protein
MVCETYQSPNVASMTQFQNKRKGGFYEKKMSRLWSLLKHNPHWLDMSILWKENNMNRKCVGKDFFKPEPVIVHTCFFCNSNDCKLVNGFWLCFDHRVQFVKRKVKIFCKSTRSVI